GLRVPEDTRGQLGAERRVERDGDGAEGERPEQGEEELLAGGEDEGDLVAGPEAPGGERAGVAEARRVEPLGGEGLTVEREVHAVRRRGGATGHEVEEGRGRRGMPGGRRRGHNPGECSIRPVGPDPV